MGIDLTFIKFDPQEFEREVLREYAKEVNLRLSPYGNELLEFTRDEATQALLTSSEYAAMTSPPTLYELGAPGPNSINGSAEEILSGVIDEVVANMSLEIIPAVVQGGQVRAGLTIELFDGDLDKLTTLPDAQFISERGYQVEWLRWVLEEGTSPVVAGFHVEFGRGFGRTGGAKMSRGGSWSVPDRVAGVEDSNWITRNLERVAEKLELAMPVIAERHF